MIKVVLTTESKGRVWFVCAITPYCACSIKLNPIIVTHQLDPWTNTNDQIPHRLFYFVYCINFVIKHLRIVKTIGELHILIQTDCFGLCGSQEPSPLVLFVLRRPTMLCFFMQFLTGVWLVNVSDKCVQFKNPAVMVTAHMLEGFHAGRQQRSIYTRHGNSLDRHSVPINKIHSNREDKILLSRIFIYPWKTKRESKMQPHIIQTGSSIMLLHNL